MPTTHLVLPATGGGAPRGRTALKLQLRGITKRFGDLVANDQIDLVVEPGEIHALLGENGAGKSTLMNVLYGLLQPDEGEILVNDEVRHFKSPGDAIAAGIGMVHQHFMLVPVFSVTENIMLGAEQTKGGPVGLLNRRSARAHVLEVSQRYGLPVDPDATIEDLPVGVQQRVEIIKALVREVDLLILDEPTAVLTPQEADSLFETLRVMAEEGRTVIFISHKLHEVKAVSDRVTVLRGGRTIATVDTADATPQSLASLMVGREVAAVGRVERTGEAGEPVLEARGLSALGDRGSEALSEYTFNREIVHHQFCRTCGIEPFAFGVRPSAAEKMVAVNVRCLDGIDLDGLAPRMVDGKSF